MQTTMGKAIQPPSPSVFQFDEKFPFRAGEDFIPLSAKADELATCGTSALEDKSADSNERFLNMKRKKGEISSSDSSEDEEEKPPVAPWKRRKYPANAYGLHLEILDFYEFMSPLPEEEAMRKDVVRRMTDVITELWPSAKVEVFGSFRTKSYLPTSDIDLVVFGKWKNLPLFTLEKALVSKDIADPAAIKVLDKASVPIIKLTDKQSKVRVDISFNTDTAVKGAELIKNYMDEFKVLPYLFRILKHFLVQRDLNEVFTGGISSYCLMLLVISFLQRHPRTDAKKDAVNLGVLLMEFFELYGRNFNYQRIGIKLTNGGRYISKDEIMKEMGNGEYPPLLCIEDPITQGIDIGKSSFGIMRVKEAFEYAFNVVDSALRNRYYFKVNPNSTYLSRIIGIPKEVLEYRKWVQSTYASQILCSPNTALVLPAAPAYHQVQTAFNGNGRPPLLPTPPSPYSPRITLVASPLLQFPAGASGGPYGQVGFFNGVAAQPLILPGTTTAVISTHAAGNLRSTYSSSSLSNLPYASTVAMNAPGLGQIAYVVPAVFTPTPVEQVISKPPTPVFSPVRAMPFAIVTSMASAPLPAVNPYGSRRGSPRLNAEGKENVQPYVRVLTEPNIHGMQNASVQYMQPSELAGASAGFEIGDHSILRGFTTERPVDAVFPNEVSYGGDKCRPSRNSSPTSSDSDPNSSVIIFETPSNSKLEQTSTVSGSRAHEVIVLSDDEACSSKGALETEMQDSLGALTHIANLSLPEDVVACSGEAFIPRHVTPTQSYHNRSSPDIRRRWTSQGWGRK